MLDIIYELTAYMYIKLNFVLLYMYRLKTSRPAPPPNVKRTIVTVGERNRFQRCVFCSEKHMLHVHVNYNRVCHSSPNDCTYCVCLALCV